MYQLEVPPVPAKQIKKLIKSKPLFQRRIQKTFDLLSQNPHHIGLKTHKVSTKLYGEHFSSGVTRVFWHYYQGKIIIVLAVTDHSAYN